MSKNSNIIIEICHGKSCANRCARLITERAQNEISFRNISNVKIHKTHCLGKCETGPNIRVTHKTGTQEIKNKLTAIEMGKIIKNL